MEIGRSEYRMANGKVRAAAVRKERCKKGQEDLRIQPLLLMFHKLNYISP